MPLLKGFDKSSSSGFSNAFGLRFPAPQLGVMTIGGKMPTQEEFDRLLDANRRGNKIIHDQVVGMQAALIEAHHNGQEAGLKWIYNALWDLEIFQTKMTRGLVTQTNIGIATGQMHSAHVKSVGNRQGGSPTDTVPVVMIILSKRERSHNHRIHQTEDSRYLNHSIRRRLVMLTLGDLNKY